MIIGERVPARRWWIALALVIFAGYTLGNRALRDNAAGRAIAVPR